MDSKDHPAESTTPVSETTPDFQEIKKSKKPGPRPTPCIWCGSTTCFHCQCTGYAKCDHPPGTQCTRQRYKRRLVCNPCEKSKLKNSMAQLSEADYDKSSTIKKTLSDIKLNRSISVDSALNKTMHKNSYSFKALLDTVMSAVKEQERNVTKQKDLPPPDLKPLPTVDDNQDDDIGMSLDEPLDNPTTTKSSLPPLPSKSKLSYSHTAAKQTPPPAVHVVKYSTPTLVQPSFAQYTSPPSTVQPSLPAGYTLYNPSMYPSQLYATNYYPNSVALQTTPPPARTSPTPAFIPVQQANSPLPLAGQELGTNSVPTASSPYQFSQIPAYSFQTVPLNYYYSIQQPNNQPLQKK